MNVVWMLVTLMMVRFSATTAQQAAAAETGLDSQSVGRGVDGRELQPLERPVTIVLHDVSLVAAIQAIDRQADLRLGYTDRIFPAGKRISLAIDLLPAGEALERVLRGTGVVVLEAADGQLVLTPPTDSKSRTPSSARP